MKRVYSSYLSERLKSTTSACILHYLFYLQIKAQVFGYNKDKDGKYWSMLPLSELCSRYSEYTISKMSTALKIVENSGFVETKINELKDKCYTLTDEFYKALQLANDLEWMETEAYLSLSGKPKIIDRESSKTFSKKSSVKKDKDEDKINNNDNDNDINSYNNDKYSSASSHGSSLLDFPTSELRINGKTVDEMFEDMKTNN